MVFSLCFVNFNKGNFVFVNFIYGCPQELTLFLHMWLISWELINNQNILVLVYLTFYKLLGKF
jgi:hypothetical protein